MNFSELDTACYLCSPGYTWGAMKRFIYVRLKLISDAEKYQFTESMMRGAISMIWKG